jgi:hypothetical protein
MRKESMLIVTTVKETKEGGRHWYVRDGGHGNGSTVNSWE